MKRSYFSVIASVLMAAAFSMCAIAPAQAATPGVYNMASDAKVINVTNIKAVKQYSATYFQLQYEDDTLSSTYYDPGTVVYNKIKADPNFITFGNSGDVLVNLRMTKYVTQYNPTWVTVKYLKGADGSYADPLGAGYAAAVAASN